MSGKVLVNSTNITEARLRQMLANKDLTGISFLHEDEIHTVIGSGFTRGGYTVLVGDDPTNRFMTEAELVRILLNHALLTIISNTASHSSIVIIPNKD